MEWIIEGAEREFFFRFFFLSNIHTYFRVWVSSFSAHECFIFGNIFQSQRVISFNNI